MRFPGPRFSLFSFLLATGLVCVSVAHWRLLNDYAAVQLDRTNLREELGYLNVKDPAKAYLRQVDSYHPLTWTYRVYLPPEKRFRLNLMTIDGHTGVSITDNNHSDSPFAGRFTLTVAIAKDLETDVPYLSAATRSHKLRAPVVERVNNRVLRQVEWWEGSAPTQQEQREFSSDQTIEVFRRMNRFQDSQQAGVAVWFDPED